VDENQPLTGVIWEKGITGRIEKYNIDLVTKYKETPVINPIFL
jgi:hypothetical protein